MLSLKREQATSRRHKIRGIQRANTILTQQQTAHPDPIWTPVVCKYPGAGPSNLVQAANLAYAQRHTRLCLPDTAHLQATSRPTHHPPLVRSAEGHRNTPATSPTPYYATQTLALASHLAVEEGNSCRTGRPV